MQAFRVLEHTAGIGFEAFGVTREEVFANAACALMNQRVLEKTSQGWRAQVYVDI